MAETGLVSIIVPTHNRADMLAKALDSIKRQTYEKWEVFVVGNDCRDHTNQIMKRYIKDGRIHFINIPEAIGAAKARNVGIKRAKGEYIAFLDDDDEWLPDKAQRQVIFLERNLNIRAVSCWYILMIGGKSQKVVIPSIVTFNDLLWRNYLGSFSFSIFKREVFETIGLLDEMLPSCQDWDFWLRVIQKVKVEVIPEYLVLYHKHYQQRISSFVEGKLSGRERLLLKYKKDMGKKCRRHHLKHIYYYKSLSTFSKRDRVRSLLKMFHYISRKRDIFIFIDSLWRLFFPDSLVIIIKKRFRKYIVLRSFLIGREKGY
ncbi:glycosyltransferase family 2 protein [Thermodesulfobacteriota bacterium]